MGKQSRCGHRLGHRAALGLVAIYRPRLFEAWRLLDYFITSSVIACLAALQWAALCCLMGKAGT